MFEILAKRLTLSEFPQKVLANPSKLRIYPCKMDHSPIRQTFELGKLITNH